MPNTLAITRLSAAGFFLVSWALFPATARADDFPEGPGKEILMKVCTQCHDLQSIPQLKYSRREWDELVTRMQENGADATRAEFDSIIAYLTKNFGKGSAADKVNVNTAAAGEIEKGLGLTTKEAAAVVEYRAKNGNFKTLDDLKKVEGADAKKLDAASDRVAF